VHIFWQSFELLKVLETCWDQWKWSKDFIQNLLTTNVNFRIVIGNFTNINQITHITYKNQKWRKKKESDMLTGFVSAHRTRALFARKNGHSYYDILDAIWSNFICADEYFWNYLLLGKISEDTKFPATNWCTGNLELAQNLVDEILKYALSVNGSEGWRFILKQKNILRQVISRIFTLRQPTPGSWMEIRKFLT